MSEDWFAMLMATLTLGCLMYLRVIRDKIIREGGIRNGKKGYDKENSHQESKENEVTRKNL